MHDLARYPQKRFRNLFDEAAAEKAGVRSVGGAGWTAIENSDLGPSVGDDQAPFPRDVTVLGPSVGDDGHGANPSILGPSVGDDLGASDLRLKQDLHRIGTTVFGLPLYHFRYRGQAETYEGVLAQDVLQVMPSAVSVAADGYYQVNYGALRTRMRRVS